MVEIKPFKGLLYNKEKIKDFSLVITPPYDVISEEKKADYLKRSHYNFVNLILADSHDGAAKTLTKFQNNGVLKQDDEESIYIYQQRYMVDGKNYTRTGFIALLKLEGFGKNILPHEKTMDRPYENRLRLLKATKANLGTILMMYDDKKKVIDKKIKEKIEKPYINFDADGINHKLFKIDDPRFAEFVKVNMKNQQCIIADGHHRYRASLQYSKEKNYNYVMACFVNSFNEGMVILPTNRLISGLQNPHYMTNRMRACFDVKEVDSIEIINKGMKNAGIFGFYDNILGKSYLLKLRGLGDVKLDVEILHQKIIEDILEIDDGKQKKGKNIVFVKGTEETVKKLEDKKYQFGFFVNPPKMSQIFGVARSNKTMPQKSTYFYPKVYSGLVINKFEV